MKSKMLWIGSVIILFLSVICFVVFGVGTEIIKAITGSDDTPVFGSYDGYPIGLAPNTDFANAVQNYTNYFQQQGGELDESAYFYIYTYAFNSAVQAVAARTEVGNSGYKPSDKSLSRLMLPYFTGPDGKFDPRFYNSVSEADKTTLKKNLAAQVVAARYSDDFFGSDSKVGGKELFGRKTSKKEMDFIKSMISEKRSFDLVSYNKLDYPVSEVKAFASANKDLFNTYSLSVITFNDEATAKKVAAQIEKNEITFKDAITSFSEKYYSNGEGKIVENYEYQIKANLDNKDDFAAIAALEQDKVSGIIKNVRGFSIYRNDGSKDAPDFNNRETLDGVKAYILEKETGRIEDYFLTKANGFIADATVAGFDKAASKEGLSVTKIPAFPLNYGDTSMADKIPSENIKEFTYANSSENLLAKAFGLKNGEISEPVVLGNFIIVMKLTGRQVEEATAETEEKIVDSALEYDRTDAQSTILSSKKVENNVTDVYFNKMLKNK